MSTIINNNAITKMYKGDTPIYSFSINSGGDINLTNIDITTNGTYTAPDGEGYKTINVDVPTGGGIGKINVNDYGLKLTNSTISEIPDVLDCSEVKDANYFFDSCGYLTNVDGFGLHPEAYSLTYTFARCYSLSNIPNIDVSNISDFSYTFFNTPIITAPSWIINGSMDATFHQCNNLEDITNLDMTNSTYNRNTFCYCPNLVNVGELNLLETTNTSYMFANCPNLTHIDVLNMPKARYSEFMFQTCEKLESLPLIDCSSLLNSYDSLLCWQDTFPNLTHLGGFKNLKASFNWLLNDCPHLTVESLMNVINNLWDWTDYPDGRVYNEYHYEWDDYGTDHYLQVGQTNLDKLTPEQIAVGVAKGWRLVDIV